jgi:polyphosphate:AMP phosphotransferase
VQQAATLAGTTTLLLPRDTRFVRDLSYFRAPGMFEAAELGTAVTKEHYKARVPRLRAELLDVQRLLRERARFPVIVVFAGVDGAGKGETVNLLNEWMDPRWLVTRAFGEPTDEELERPECWRYWRALPPRGHVGLFLSSWYSPPLLNRVYRRINTAEFDECLNRIVRFEKALADDGALILKFWMHLGRAAQKKRLRKLEKDPLTRWRVTKRQWQHWSMYDKFVAAAERSLQRTSTGQAPWTIVEGVDERYRSLKIATVIRDAIRARLEASSAPATPQGRRSHTGVALAARPSNPGSGMEPFTRYTILERLDMSQRIDKATFLKRLEKAQGRLNLLHRKASARGISSVLVFEGWDAAGKGGAIRRVTAALDARASQVIPIAAPTDEERAHQYLWRFWRHLPRAGLLTIFDRSWYGRVLVERVEGFATQADWLRAYGEINEFEEQLVAHGIVLVKYWLHVTPDEQLRRFKERQRAPYKRWKLTGEDWRNREKWDKYARAVNEMVERTSTRLAPWTLVEANDKYHARIKTLDTICRRLEAALD